MQDDGESFADDQPGDDFYDVPISRFRILLRHRLSNVSGPGFDNELFASRIAEIIVPPEHLDLLHIEKQVAHDRVQIVFDLVDDPKQRAETAHEALVLLEELTMIQRGTV